MPGPRALSADANASDLTSWLTEWAERYPYGYDDILTGISRPASKMFGLAELVDIFTWKLDARWRGIRVDELRAHHDAHPSSISSATNAAMTATDDAAALGCLLPIPGMKDPKAAAVRSAGLMVADPDRWSPADRMANSSLVALRDLLAPQAKDVFSPLHEAATVLSDFRPRPDTTGALPATASDWPQYMRCCRTISTVTWLSLRTVDRGPCALHGSWEVIGLINCLLRTLDSV